MQLLCLVLQERNIQTSAEWRQQMGDVDVGILEHMRTNIKGGFDEEKHGPRIGFGNLKRYDGRTMIRTITLCTVVNTAVPKLKFFTYPDVCSHACGLCCSFLLCRGV